MTRLRNRSLLVVAALAALAALVATHGDRQREAAGPRPRDDRVPAGNRLRAADRAEDSEDAREAVPGHDLLVARALVGRRDHERRHRRRHPDRRRRHRPADPRLGAGSRLEDDRRPRLGRSLADGQGPEHQDDRRPEGQADRDARTDVDPGRRAQEDGAGEAGRRARARFVDHLDGSPGRRCRRSSPGRSTRISPRRRTSSRRRCAARTSSLAATSTSASSSFLSAWETTKFYNQYPAFSKTFYDDVQKAIKLINTNPTKVAHLLQDDSDGVPTLAAVQAVARRVRADLHDAPARPDAVRELHEQDRDDQEDAELVA